MYKNIALFILIGMLGITLHAQQAIIEIDNDDTLPIAPTRFDDTVEPPKDNFSSVSKNDLWEKFERGELDEKAYTRLQEQYQAQADGSKDPYVQRKNQQRKIASIKKAKLEAKKKGKKKSNKAAKKTKSGKKVAVKKANSKRVPASTKKLRAKASKKKK